MPTGFVIITLFSFSTQEINWRSQCVLTFNLMDTNGLKTCPLSHLTIWGFRIHKPTDWSLLSRAASDMHKS